MVTMVYRWTVKVRVKETAEEMEAEERQLEGIGIGELSRHMCSVDAC
jgi:hypothetical protein